MTLLTEWGVIVVLFRCFIFYLPAAESLRRAGVKPVEIRYGSADAGRVQVWKLAVRSKRRPARCYLGNQLWSVELPCSTMPPLKVAYLKGVKRWCGEVEMNKVVKCSIHKIPKIPSFLLCLLAHSFCIQKFPSGIYSAYSKRIVLLHVVYFLLQLISSFTQKAYCAADPKRQIC